MTKTAGLGVGLKRGTGWIRGALRWWVAACVAGATAMGAEAFSADGRLAAVGAPEKLPDVVSGLCSIPTPPEWQCERHAGLNALYLLLRRAGLEMDYSELEMAAGTVSAEGVSLEEARRIAGVFGVSLRERSASDVRWTDSAPACAVSMPGSGLARRWLCLWPSDAGLVVVEGSDGSRITVQPPWDARLSHILLTEEATAITVAQVPWSRWFTWLTHLVWFVVGALVLEQVAQTLRGGGSKYSENAP